MSSNSGYSSDDEGRDSDELLNGDEDSSSSGEELSEADLDLFDAVTRNNAAAVQQALRNGANVHRANSCLMLACDRGYNDIVRILLNKSADAPWSNDTGSTVMIAALNGGHVSIVEELIDHDKDFLEIADESGLTPLHTAILMERLEIVQLLLDRGANTNATTKRGSTALFLACREGANMELVRRLLAAGVDVDFRDEIQRTILHYAASRGSIEVLR